jgi:thymidylate synthase (FAD)
MSNEDARFVLPNACETKLTMTVNLRELIHICNERLCSRAQWEIRELVYKMASEVINIFPEADAWLVPKCERDPKHPFCPEHNGCGMHPKLSEVYKNE